MRLNPPGLVDDPPNSDYRIRKVANGMISTIAGGGKPGGEPGDHIPATSAWIEVANALAVDSAGNLYIAEDYALVRKVSNGVITTDGYDQ